MKKLAFAFFALFFSVLSYAQIEGKWKTIDDETGKPKSIAEIFITDPKKGKTYNCTVTRSGDKLNVRGYVGISLIGRNQTWHRVD